jgi:hypothetical protein
MATAAVTPSAIGVRAARRPPAARTSYDGCGRWSGGRVLVLNATYEPINVCTVRRATVLLLKSKAEVSRSGTRDLHWATGSLPRPVVIRLVTYVRMPARHAQAQDHPRARCSRATAGSASTAARARA